jgi:hypothetical protein
MSSHRRASGRQTRHLQHRPLHRPARQQAYEAILLGKIEHIGPQARAWAQTVLADRGVRAYRLLQGLISLARSHPRERVEWACGYTLGYGLFRYRILRRLLEQAAANAPVPELLHEHAVHVAQFACMATLIAGLLALWFALDLEVGVARWVARFGAASAVVALALYGALARATQFGRFFDLALHGVAFSPTPGSQRATVTPRPRMREAEEKDCLYDLVGVYVDTPGAGYV